MMGKIFLTFFADVSVMFTLIYGFNKWRPFAHCIERRQWNCWECVIPFTVTALTVMQYPFQLAEGYQSDLRAVPIAMAGYIGGPLVGLLVALLMIVIRTISSGMVINALSIYLLIGPTAYLLRRSLPWPMFSVQNMFILAVMINIYLNLGGWFLPPPVQTEFYAPLLMAIKAVLTFIGLYALAIALRVQVEDTRRIVVLNEQASQDSLTGLLNHGTFSQQAEYALLRGKASGVFMLIDLDYFKQINDLCGHLTGDNALKYIAQILRESLRSRDIVGRLGGEEFGVLLQNTDLDQAMAIGKRIQERTRQYQGMADTCNKALTMSIGVTAFTPGPNSSFNVVFQRADAALYRAKAQGRNRIEIN